MTADVQSMRVEPQSMRLSLADMVGNEPLKKHVESSMEMASETEEGLGSRRDHRYLLFGAVGTGKSAMALAAAKTFDWPAYYMNTGDLE